jgi:hypothetical protein
MFQVYSYAHGFPKRDVVKSMSKLIGYDTSPFFVFEPVGHFWLVMRCA